MPSVYLTETPGAIALTGNSMPVKFQANEITGLSFVRIVMKVFFMDPVWSTWNEVSEETAGFDENNTAQLFIQELFSDVRLMYNIMDLSGSTLQIPSYKLSYQMTWFNNEGNSASTEWQESDIMQALPAGISREFEANWNYNDIPVDELYSMLGDRFLSNHPPIKKLTPNQYDFLGVLVMNRASTLKLTKIVNGVETSFKTFDSNQNNTVVIVKIDPTAEFANTGGKFSIVLKNNNVVLDQRDYYLDTTGIVTAVLYFRNSFGTMDSVVCKGEREAERDISKNIYVAGRQEIPSLISPDIISGRGNYNTVFSADIGYHNSRDFQDFLTDLIISDDCWMTEGDSIFPVIINVEKYPLLLANNNIFSAKITWQRCFTEKYLTKIYVPVTPPNPDENTIIDSEGNEIQDDAANNILYI